MACDDDHQRLTTKFRLATGITHTNPNHGPVSDKSDPSSQVARYSPKGGGCKTMFMTVTILSVPTSA